MNALPRVLFSAAALTSFRLLVLKQSGFPTFVFFPTFPFWPVSLLPQLKQSTCHSPCFSHWVANHCYRPLCLSWPLIISDSDVSTALTVMSWLLSTQDRSWPQRHQCPPVTVTITSRACHWSGLPACSDSPSGGSHNSCQTSLMIPCLLRPLWVLGETMGRYRLPLTPPVSLNCISLVTPTTPLSFHHTYIWLKVVCHPHTTHPPFSAAQWWMERLRN